MIVSKIQRRPRSLRFRFTNDEVLLFDTNSPIRLVDPPALGFTYELRECRCILNSVQKYNNVSATGFMTIISGFFYSASVQNTDAMSGLNHSGMNTLFHNSSSGFVTGMWPQANWVAAGAQGTVSEDDMNDGLDLSLLAGDIHLRFVNSGDLTGGDPANWFELWIDYNIS